MEIDLCSHCGGPAYAPAALLAGVSFALYRSGLWLFRSATAGGRISRWSVTALLWALAATAASAAWRALG